MKSRHLVWAVQAVAVAVVLFLVVPTVGRHWNELRTLDVKIEVRPLWVGLSVVLTSVTYALQVESWRRLLAGWQQSVGFWAAARAWCLANLGRYLPGKVWSVAGMVILAQRAGVGAAPAAASAVIVQALGFGAGTAVVIGAIPGLASPWRLVSAAVAAAAAVVLVVWRPTARRIERVLGSAGPFPPLRASAVVAAGAFTLASWLTYGVAFWMVARGLGPVTELPVRVAVGIFPLGYLLGLLALFAPGGVGVRDLAYVGLLTPYLGTTGAVTVSLGSRILLTVTEALAALLALLAEKRVHGGRG